MRDVHGHGDLDGRAGSSGDRIARRRGRGFLGGRRWRRRLPFLSYDGRHCRYDDVVVVSVLVSSVDLGRREPRTGGRCRRRIAGKFPGGFGGYLRRFRPHFTHRHGASCLHFEGMPAHRLVLRTARWEGHRPTKRRASDARLAAEDARFVDHRSRVRDDDAAADLVRPFEVELLGKPRPIAGVRVGLRDSRKRKFVTFSRNVSRRDGNAKKFTSFRVLGREVEIAGPAS